MIEGERREREESNRDDRVGGREKERKVKMQLRMRLLLISRKKIKN